MRHVIGEDIGRRRAFPVATLKRIESAIADQEQRHAGEVRFAVEGGLSPARVLAGMTPRQRAEELFAQLRVWDTEHNNGVLIYLLLADHAVEVVADRGIHAKVGDAAWQEICDAMQPLLKDGRYEKGVLTGLSLAGQLLERHFPTAGGRGNELPDAPIVL
ncbi:MAG TPA: TPM domain-containing protein [Burkholderiales bacterium]|nr:TPM domain-containing protein [Burkholderiales bacterium]